MTVCLLLLESYNFLIGGTQVDEVVSTAREGIEPRPLPGEVAAKK